MGADLLLTNLIHDKDKKLDWTEGRKVARKLPIDTVQRGLAEIRGEEAETAKEARLILNDIISALKSELNGEPGRDAHSWEIGGKVVHVRGGTSWGEDPSEGWTTFTSAHWFPQVLEAIGFDIEALPQPQPKSELEKFIDENGPEVVVSHTVPVFVTVNLAQGAVSKVNIAVEQVQPDDGHAMFMSSDNDSYHDAGAEVTQRALEIAKAADVEWPAWSYA